jgi:hypothetical protein
VIRLRDEFVPASREDIDGLLEDIVDPTVRGTAIVSLPERGAARLRNAARDHGDGTWAIDFSDSGILVAEVIEAGAVILEPRDVAAQQREALESVARAHEGDHTHGGRHA